MSGKREAKPQGPFSGRTGRSCGRFNRSKSVRTTADELPEGGCGVIDSASQNPRTQHLNLVLLVGLVLAVVFATVSGSGSPAAGEVLRAFLHPSQVRRGRRDHLRLAAAAGAGGGSGGSGLVGHRRFVSGPVSQSPGRSFRAGNLGRRGLGRGDWNFPDPHAFLRRLQRHRRVGLHRLGADHDSGVVSGASQRRLCDGNFAAGRLRHRHHAERRHCRLRDAARRLPAPACACWRRGCMDSSAFPAWSQLGPDHATALSPSYSRCRWQAGSTLSPWARNMPRS